MKLSKNFNLNEFLVSKDHPELAKRIVTNEQYINRLKLLCESILEPIRSNWFDEPIHIQSGIRSIDLNSAVGGIGTSDHLLGNACDFTAENITQKFIWSIYEKLPFRQIILYPDKNTIHVSINMPGNKFKHEALVKYKGNKKYMRYSNGRIPKSSDIIK